LKNRFKGDGDFRSEEAVELLKQADIIVTNPPFSLFREYIAQLVKHKKKFLILANPNAITYKEIFPLFKNNKIWLGHRPIGVDMLFDVPPAFADKLVKTKKEGSGYRIIDGKVKGRAAATWFTNLDNARMHENIELYRSYKKRRNKAEYPTYDNYKAIEVPKIVEIPVDYSGAMGVPVSFLGKYNPEQFELVGMGEDNGRGQSGGVWKGGSLKCLIKGQAKFKRIFIRNKNPEE